jgi:hypothetical protein
LLVRGAGTVQLSKWSPTRTITATWNPRLVSSSARPTAPGRPDGFAAVSCTPCCWCAPNAAVAINPPPKSKILPIRSRAGEGYLGTIPLVRRLPQARWRRTWRCGFSCWSSPLLRGRRRASRAPSLRPVHHPALYAQLASSVTSAAAPCAMTAQVAGLEGRCWFAVFGLVALPLLPPSTTHSHSHSPPPPLNPSPSKDMVP